MSAAQVAERTSAGSSPIVIDPPLRGWLPTPCPEGACARVPQSVPCATVIWTRIGADTYRAYAVEGGP